MKTYGAGDDGANSNNRASRVAGGVILTALAMCAAALSADPIVGTQMGMGMFSSLGDGRGHKGGRSSSGDAAVSTLGEIDFFPMTVYLAVRVDRPSLLPVKKRKKRGEDQKKKTETTFATAHRPCTEKRKKTRAFAV